MANQSPHHGAVLPLGPRLVVLLVGPRACRLVDRSSTCPTGAWPAVVGRVACVAATRAHPRARRQRHCQGHRLQLEALGWPRALPAGRRCAGRQQPCREPNSALGPGGLTGKVVPGADGAAGAAAAGADHTRQGLSGRASHGHRRRRGPALRHPASADSQLTSLRCFQPPTAGVGSTRRQPCEMPISRPEARQAPSARSGRRAAIERTRAPCASSRCTPQSSSWPPHC